MAFRPSYGMSSYPPHPGYQQHAHQPIVFGQMRMPGQQPPPVKQNDPTPVFVGNISEKCTDQFIQKMLNECGTVSTWKRVQGTNGKWQAFGFCNFAELEGTLRALRILHDFHLGEKKLTVKAEEKVRSELRRTAIENRRRQGKKDLKLRDDELPADDDDLKKDEEIRLKILHWIETDHPELLTIAEDGELSDKEGKKAIKEESNHADRHKKEDRNRRRRSRTKSKERARRSRSRESPRGNKRRRGRSSSSSSDSGSSRSHSTASSYTSRSRTRSPVRAKSSKRRRDRSGSRTSEDSEDARERRFIRQQLKEKEQAYMVRLKRWESREKQQSKKYEKEERKEIDKKRLLQKEAKKLKHFMEEYDDEKHDLKYYKRSTHLFALKKVFEREKEADVKDRLREQQEIEELKKQILEEANADVDVDEEAKKRHQLKEAEALRKLRADSGSPNPHQPLGQSANGAEEESSSDEETAGSEREKSVEPDEGKGDSVQDSPVVPPKANGGWKSIGGTNGDVINQTLIRPEVVKKEVASPAGPVPIAQRLNGVFGNDDEEDEMHKRKKLVPFEISREDRIQTMSQEEKKELTKTIIKRIPTNKEELFGSRIEWNHIDHKMMEERVRPWIARKIKSYLGEEEQSLCDFLCEKIEQRTAPDQILTDVAVIIDEDAEIFVIKLWRLLVYEGQARKLGIA